VCTTCRDTARLTEVNAAFRSLLLIRGVSAQQLAGIGGPCLSVFTVETWG